MKYLIILGALLWLLLSWFANSVGLKAEEVTTNNLLDQNLFLDKQVGIVPLNQNFIRSAIR